MNLCYMCNATIEYGYNAILDDDTHFICSTCSDKLYWCNECNYYYDLNDVWYIFDDSINNCICNNCTDNFYSCDLCGYPIHVDYTDHMIHGEYVCSSCYANRDGIIYPYSYKPNPYRYCSLDEEPDKTKTIGIELEIDDGNNRDDLAIEIFDAFGGLVYCKEDGSLSSDGVELVSHPMTYKYIKHNRVIEKMCNIARDFDYLSYDTDTCGLHLHFDKSFFGETTFEQKYTVVKICYFLYLNYNEIVRFSKRDEDKLEEWAEVLNMRLLNLVKHDDSRLNEVIFDHYEKLYNSRYIALNVIPSATNEFRIFKGTLHIESIYQYIRWCIKLIEICKNATLEDIRILDNKTIIEKSKGVI